LEQKSDTEASRKRRWNDTETTNRRH